MWYKHLSAGCFPFSSWADPKSLNPPRHVRTHNENIHTCINQQNECAPSADSDQPGHSPSLIRVFAVRMKKAWVLSYPLSAQRRLIRLVGCPGWSESSLCAQPHCWFCHIAAHYGCTPKLSIQYQTRGEEYNENSDAMETGTSISHPRNWRSGWSNQRLARTQATVSRPILLN